MWVYLNLCILCLIHENDRSTKICHVFSIEHIIYRVPAVNVFQPAPEKTYKKKNPKNNLEQFHVKQSTRRAALHFLSWSTFHSRCPEVDAGIMWSQMGFPREYDSSGSHREAVIDSLAETTHIWWCASPPFQLICCIPHTIVDWTSSTKHQGRRMLLRWYVQLMSCANADGIYYLGEDGWPKTRSFLYRL